MSHKSTNAFYFDLRAYAKGNELVSQNGRAVHLYHWSIPNFEPPPTFPETIVVKTTSTNDTINAAALKRLMDHDHPNIVKALGIFWNIHFKYYERPIKAIIFEYCENGDLDAQGSIKKEQFFDWTFDIAEGLKFLHDNGIVHGDVKPKNVFLKNNGKRLVAKLGDFDDFFTNGNGAKRTPAFQAPDREMVPTKSCDVFSFAATVNSLWGKVSEKDGGDIDEFLQSYGNPKRSKRPSMATFIKEKSYFKNMAADKPTEYYYNRWDF